MPSINAIADNTYKEALSKIPNSEHFMMSNNNNATASSIIEIIRTTPIGDLKRLIAKDNEEKNNEEKNNECLPRILTMLKELGVFIGSSIKFGSEKWKVIDIKNDCVWLMSERVLSKRSFNDKCIQTSWAECSLRQWLNDKFLCKFIDLQNIRYILETKIQSDRKSQINQLDNAESTLMTSDKVFVLSEEEFENYKQLIDSEDFHPRILRTSSHINGDDFVLTYQRGKVDTCGVRVDYPVDIQPVLRLDMQYFIEVKQNC